MKVENDVLDVVVAQVALEGRHDATSPSQYGGANHVIRGGSATGKQPAIKDTMQVRGDFSQVEPCPAVAAAAVHFEEMISARDGFGSAALHVGTPRQRRQGKGTDEKADHPSLAA